VNFRTFWLNLALIFRLIEEFGGAGLAKIGVIGAASENPEESALSYMVKCTHIILKYERYLFRKIFITMEL